MDKYDQHYSAPSFWDKLKKHAGQAGKKVVYTALLAYYALENPKTPTKAKLTIYSALGYLILPIDLVPDFIPVVGFGDDLAALLLAVGQVATYINDEVRTNARNKMQDWFGTVSVDDRDIIEVEAEVVESARKSGDEAAAGKSN
ncbi:YkvA family protein [Paenibacillus sp. YYML68]|uniref:YkvA family protein n=1 Tax=Paenibacillus sp. YYML68 TaxID=2909250 RepID=UPI00248FA763|nr:YkvA family protein [Paenibacillus sp. YYML68]